MFDTRDRKSVSLSYRRASNARFGFRPPRVEVWS